MELNREMFEPEALEMNDLEAEVVLSFLTEKGRQEIQTCAGDIYKIVNMLMDYARLLELAVEQWGLEGFHKANYELHAEQCRGVAQKYAAGIGYDYEKAMEKCRRKMAKPRRDDGVGEDALVLAMRKKRGPEGGAGEKEGNPVEEAIRDESGS